MSSYTLTRDAKEDLWRIYEYGVRTFGEIQADKYLKMLHNCFAKIASNPFMFPKADRLPKGYRYCVCGVDTIYYKITDEVVEVITIIGKQDYK